MSKDFSSMNTDRAGGRAGVQKKIRQSMSRKGQQAEATPEEAQTRAASLKTQGRKGCKAIRINMAFTPENHEFIKVMSRLTGKTMTEFANLTIEKYREEHPELYAQAKAIIEQL